jgi:hypothetical protein
MLRIPHRGDVKFSCPRLRDSRKQRHAQSMPDDNVMPMQEGLCSDRIHLIMAVIIILVSIFYEGYWRHRDHAMIDGAMY